MPVSGAERSPDHRTENFVFLPGRRELLIKSKSIFLSVLVRNGVPFSSILSKYSAFSPFLFPLDNASSGTFERMGESSATSAPASNKISVDFGALFFIPWSGVTGADETPL